MQQGGSPYGAPPHDSMTNFSYFPPSAAAFPPQQQMAGGGGTAESLVPQSIGARISPPPSTAPPNYEELGAAEVDPLGDKGTVGGGGMWGGCGGGNRWPRQETLALLKIRSDMDTTFRNATLKGPLWEEVSRKLTGLGYSRSGKKCKEKFENVHKYYKRTKEGRAGRQDGKSYRFFSELEALHGTATAAAQPSHFTSAAALPVTTTTAAAASAAMGTPTAAPASTVTNQSPLSVAERFSQTPPPQQQQQQQISAPTPIATAPPQQQQPMPMPMPMLGHEHQQNARSGMSFSSNTSSDAMESDDREEEDDDDDEATEEGPSSGKKRKRVDGGAGRGRKMMALFEGLMRQVMERQEGMQQRFLEAIEKREQDRMIREEAWRRQETGRLAREQELAAGERASAAARNAVVISFLQKVTGQTVPIPSHPHPAPTPTPTPTPIPTPTPTPTPAPASATVSIVQTPPPMQIHPQQLTRPLSQPQQQQTPPPMRPTASELVPLSSDPHEGGATMSLDPASSRWPKSEVHALIKLRSELDSRYQESGPKGPLWEEISAGMRRLGYSRSSRRCKEKWENINKYFKKVKESNKKRPEDAKTCPYFHQLDALYRNKRLNDGGSGTGTGTGTGGGGVPALTNRPHEHESQLNPSSIANPISVIPPSLQQQQLPPTMNQRETDVKKKGSGDVPTTFSGDNRAGGHGENSTSSGTQKKPEDIVKELMGQSGNDYGRLDEPERDNKDDDETNDDEDEEDGKGHYTIEFQRPNVGRGANGSDGGASTAGPPSSGRKAAGSFLAMVR